jgi:hypothetical protein
LLRIGNLWVTVDSERQRILLTNSAARKLISNEDQRPKLTVNRGEISKDSDTLSVGTYAIADGPACQLRISRGIRSDAVSNLLEPLNTSRSPDILIDYTVSGHNRRAVWKDGFCLSEGVPVGSDDEDANVNLVFEMLLQLLSRQDLLAVLHASAVLWRGRRLVMMGQSGSGKTTLAAQLVADGGEWLGDDYVVMMRNGDIVPIPFSPSFKAGSWTLLLSAFPELGEANTLKKGDTDFRYLPHALFAASENLAPSDVLLFPKYSSTLPPKEVHLSQEEVLYHLSKSGLWLELDDVETFFTKILDLPAFALRHTPDFDATVAILRRQCLGKQTNE